MTTIWKPETHKTVIRLNEGSQGSEAVGKTGQHWISGSCSQGVDTYFAV